MRNKKQIEDNYTHQRITSPYKDHAPKPIPTPEGIKLDHEPLEMSDGSTVDAPTPAEVTLSKFIRPGFVHDFVLAMRGTETTTLMSIWGALFAISSVLQRRSWQDWVIQRLYPNLYLIFIARPGVCKKSVSITFGAKVVSLVPELFKQPEDKEIYGLPLWEGGATPEYLFEILKPKEVMISGDAMGFDRPFMLGSRIAIIADELSEFLGRQKYNQGMISRLTKLYDCPEIQKVGTKKDKTLVVKNVFANFFGGTTPDSFRDTIPAEAHGGGLMSRCILVWQQSPTRVFYRPQRIEGAPGKEELARRLAWIAEHRMGEYKMTEAADALYYNWYAEHKADLENIHDSDTRADILLVKTAHLIAASGYKPTQKIDENDVQAAITLIELAMKQKHKAETELMIDSEWAEAMQRVEAVIRSKGTVERRDLLRAVSRNYNADLVNQVLTALAQSAAITIEVNGKERGGPTQAGHELYIWTK